MTRWIVSPTARTVRACSEAGICPHVDNLRPGEFFYDAPTAADAMMAGRWHLLAKEALTWAFRYEARKYELRPEQFVVVADRIEAQASDGSLALNDTLRLLEVLSLGEYDVWREGVTIVVLRGPK
jgi:hypothetical protein